MYCNNCGKKGHVFRTCTDPVISCGIILLRGIYEPLKLPVDPRTVSALMVKRKDSMSYVEFIRGKYDIDNMDYVRTLVSNMTVAEQAAICAEPFEVLWRRMWGAGRDAAGSEFRDAQEKFGALDRGAVVQGVPSKFADTEWGFPKGRRMRGETDIQAAIREFFEETNIPSDAYVLCDNMVFTEVFSGTNGVSYKHVYFIALLHSSRQINIEQKLTSMQRREISAVDWKTLTGCKAITRPHYIQRKEILDSIERTIATYQILA